MWVHLIDPLQHIFLHPFVKCMCGSYRKHWDYTSRQCGRRDRLQDWPGCRSWPDPAHWHWAWSRDTLGVLKSVLPWTWPGWRRPSSSLGHTMSLPSDPEIQSHQQKRSPCLDKFQPWNQCWGFREAYSNDSDNNIENFSFMRHETRTRIFGPIVLLHFLCCSFSQN